jgi:hypothetical protein
MSILVEVLEERIAELTAQLDSSIERLNTLLDVPPSSVQGDSLRSDENISYDYITACPPTPLAKGMNYNIDSDDETIVDEYDIDYCSDEFADFHINWYPDPIEY